jgi:gluconokinase
MIVPQLRSPNEKLGGIFYFPRMLDKIRLHAAGQLPADYVPNLGIGFDGRCSAFLHLDYPAFADFVKGGASDEQALAWAFEHGRKPSDEEIEVWNEFMRKRGWNDEVTPTLQRRLREGNFGERPDVQTMFSYIDLDEGRI